MARQQTQRAVHRTGCGPAVQISLQKTNGLQIRHIQTQWTITCDVQCLRLSLPQAWNRAENNRWTHGITSGYLGQPTTRTDRQDGEKLFKLSNWRLVLELGAGDGHFEHSQWQWKSGIWSLVNCVVWLVSAMLLNWTCCGLNIFNAKKIGRRSCKITSSF